MGSIATKVKVKCVFKKEMQSYKENPKQTEIGLQVPYDQKSIYYQLSGGTAMSLHTINQEAADMFKLGEDYDLVITPSVAE